MVLCYKYSMNLILILMVAGVCGWLFHGKRVLQRKVAVLESEHDILLDRIEQVEQVQKSELTQEQEEYRDSVHTQYAVLFQQMKEQFAVAIKDQEANFKVELDKAFKKACEEINFSEIEYKRTITKKRKQFNRKNSKDAKPQRIWRYIDEE